MIIISSSGYGNSKLASISGIIRMIANVRYKHVT